MGESLILRRLGARNAEGKYAWKKKGTVLADTTVNYSGSYYYSGQQAFNQFRMTVVSEYDTKYFTEDTFINAEITGTWKIKLLAGGVCSYGETSLDYSDGTWSYDSEKSELYVVPWRISKNNLSLSLSGSGISLQPTFGFIGYVVDNDAAKYPDNGTQGEYTYEKIQS